MEYPDVETWEEGAALAADCLPEQSHVPSGIDPLVLIEQHLVLLRDEHKAFTPDGNANFYEALDVAIHFGRIADAALSGLSGEARRRQIQEVVEVITKKQYDYGHDNILWGGLPGIVLRMHDKVARIRNLTRRGALSGPGPMNEALYDSWLDIVGYSLIGIMFSDKTFTLPMAGDKRVMLSDPYDGTIAPVEVEIPDTIEEIDRG